MKSQSGFAFGGFVAAALAFTPVSAKEAARSLQQYRTAEQLAHRHLAEFDNLDFNVFSNQRWDEMRETHAPNILVHWPDGHVARGLDRHAADLKALFVYAPDTRIKQHPVKVATGEWTAVTGVLQGTFTKPMTMPDGKIVQPTGKAFTLPMATIGHWVNGVMDEEYLFWDNATYMSQLGVPK